MKKPFYKRWWFFLIIIVVIIGSLGGGGEDTPKEPIASNNEIPIETPVIKEPVVEYKVLSQEQITILDKVYAELTDAEKILYESIILTWDNLSGDDKAKYQANYDRLKSEADAFAEAERVKAEEEAAAKLKAEWDTFVTENTKTLGAGTYSAPEHIAVGVYDVTFQGSGNFFVNGNQSLEYNEIGGGSYGVSKIHTYITEDAEIEIKGMKAIFTPVQTSLLPKEGFEIYPGYWSVGTEIPEGRYIAKTVGAESGNFFVFGKNSVNEILGGTYGVESVTFNIEVGDIVNMRGMDKVIFTPSN